MLKLLDKAVDVTRLRAVRLDAGSDVVANGPDADTPAHFQLEPARSPFLFMLNAPSSEAREEGDAPILSATPAPGGFAVTVWLRDPDSQRWRASDGEASVIIGMARTTAAVNYGQMWTCDDATLADGVFFQVGNVDRFGKIDAHLAEL